jgi:glyoxylase-like metal-dependent hydrolase (beta-lactamase superfamily II)
MHTNCYLVSCRATGATVVVDPGDDAVEVAAAIRGRRPVALVLTHAHWDHVQAVDALRARLRVPVVAHPLEREVWRHERSYLAAHGQWDWALDAHLAPTDAPPPVPGWDGVADAAPDPDGLLVGRLRLQLLHTPGHTPGSLSLLVDGHLLTGDTLFPGGPGLTGWPLSDFATILSSVETLLALPDDTVVHPGHGRSTRVGDERASLAEWRRRGW